MFNFIKSAIFNTKPIPVITGIGIISPIGEGVETWWENLCNGKSGVDTIKNFDSSSYPCTSAAEVKNWDASKYMSKRYESMLSRGAQFSAAAFDLAKRDANVDQFEPYGSDVIMGAGSSEFISIEQEIAKHPTTAGMHYYETQDPTMTLKTMISTPAALISFLAKTKGYVTTHCSACVSGLDAANNAIDRITNKQAHTVIVGGVDTYVTKMLLQAFCFANAVAFDSGEKAEKTVKPFDRDRTRSVLGEGACVLILEEKKRAICRNARIYCELTVGQQSAENHNIAFTHEKSGKSWAQLIKATLKGQRVDFVNAHGPGDKIVDRIEVEALRRAFGENLQDIDITSIKSTTGGGNAFASLSQVAATAKTIYEDTIPPTVNYKTPDPELAGISPVSTVKKISMKRGLVSAHGMGGLSATVLLHRTK